MKRRDIKVVIRSPEGLYLAGGPEQWEFTDNLAEATVLHYLRDDVEGQLQRIQQAGGETLEALHIHSDELAERCDRCHVSIPPIEAFFDGRDFLCRGCTPEAEITFSE